ncbi:hypothetical protein ACFVT5_41115 [Streptomyces sp. NPDC058001]|uniref:hypothetical protein n=1 Tax=Streptomyces sp. NPDC058001 TaxID=3346300 RepID=UPI0036F0CF5E
MAGKVWHPHKAKRFAREAQLGVPYYVVLDVARNLAPYEDAQLYSVYRFTARRPFTDTPCDGAMDAVSLCQNYGPVYDHPPVGMRNVAGPGPQVAGPVDASAIHDLDATEIRHMEKRAKEASDLRREAAEKAAKRRWSRFS